MMDFFKVASRILLIPPAITLFYDLIYEFFVKNRFAIHPLHEWWIKMSSGSSLSTAKEILAKVSSSALADKYFALPAPVALLIPALVFYVIYRIIFLLQGGKSGGKGGMVYKSRH
jgi:hypothetical protein